MGEDSLKKFMWYEEIEIIGEAKGWENPRRDGTGGTLIERYHAVVEELMFQGRVIFVPKLKSNFGNGGIPRKIFVGVNPGKERQDVLEELAKQNGIDYCLKGTVPEGFVRENYEDIERRV